MHHTSQPDNFVAARDKRIRTHPPKATHPKSLAARRLTGKGLSTKATAYSVDSNDGDSDDDLQLASLTMLYGNSARFSESANAERAVDLEDDLFGEDVE